MFKHILRFVWSGSTALLFVTTWLGAQECVRSVVVIGTTKPDPSQLTLTVSTDRSAAGRCVASKEDPIGVLCRSSIPCDSSVARVEIKAFGYQEFSRNYPVVPGNGELRFNLGAQRLEQSDEPRIVQITHSRGQKGHRFGIIIENRTAKELLVKSLEMIADLPGGSGSCAIGWNAALEFSEELVMTSSSADRKEVTGYIVNPRQGVDYKTKIKGTVVTNTCHGDAHLDLVAPVELSINKGGFSGIEVFLPERFSVQQVSSRDEAATRYLALSAFSLIAFKLELEQGSIMGAVDIRNP